MTYSRTKTTHPTEDIEVGPTTQLILEEATRLGITWQEIPGTRTFELEWNGQKKLFFFQVPTATTALGLYASEDKSVTNSFLSHAGISTSKGFYLCKKDDPAYWVSCYEALNKPVVVKPTHGTHGDEVFVNITSESEYLDAVKKCFAVSTDTYSGVLVEEMFQGQEYRVLATREKVIGIVNRIPANVIGDGRSTIKQLIEKKNQTEFRIRSRKFIKIGEELHKFLAEQKLTLDSIPDQDQQIFLTRLSNISQGGDPVDVTHLAHPSVKELALAAVRAIPGLELGGIDFMTTDITQPQTKDSYIIIEVNHTPSMDIHDLIQPNNDHPAVREFLCLLFPELREHLS